MGLWSRWEEVLDAYRDVNAVFGDIIKVTPSSKCVGDLALYLVTRNIKANDLLDPVKASTIDFPESVVGLIKGDLGFPHRGFPAHIEAAILKGMEKLTVRPGLILRPVDFDQNIESLSSKWNQKITREEAMSYLMYPKVFTDYMEAKLKKGNLLRWIPTPVYFYGMVPGSSFSVRIKQSLANEVLKSPNTPEINEDNLVDVHISMERIGPLKDRHRTVVFLVNGKEQHARVKDTSGAFVFDGPMANAANKNEVYKSIIDTNIIISLPFDVKRIFSVQIDWLSYAGNNRKNVCCGGSESNCG